MRGTASDKPDWDRLFEVAAGQAGYFTTPQAADAGCSSQLLLKHIRAGRVARTRRGIYRLVHFLGGDTAFPILWNHGATSRAEAVVVVVPNGRGDGGAIRAQSVVVVIVPRAAPQHTDLT